MGWFDASRCRRAPIDWTRHDVAIVIDAIVPARGGPI
jgi:hypothetical protein